MSKKKKSELFRIPAPDKTDSRYKFYPIIRVGRIVPFGYRTDPEDKHRLLPVEEELILLEAAKQHLKNYSLRDVAAWISAKSGRYISHVGLRTRIQSEQYQQREYIDAKRIAKQFRDAYHKAKKLERGRLGLRELTEEEMDEELYRTVDQTLKD